MKICGSFCVDSGSKFQHKKEPKITSLVFARQTKLRDENKNNMILRK